MRRVQGLGKQGPRAQVGHGPDVGSRPRRAREKITIGIVDEPGPDRKADSTTSSSDTVKVHYRGTLVDGTEFDSSYARNEPAEFGLTGVIPCWTQALQRMKVGGKARLVCPSDLAYGDRGNQGIPGGAALIFEVELLGIVSR